MSNDKYVRVSLTDKWYLHCNACNAEGTLFDINIGNTEGVSIVNTSTFRLCQRCFDNMSAQKDKLNEQ